MVPDSGLAHDLAEARAVLERIDLRTPVVSIQQSCAMFTDGLLGEASPAQQEVIDLITTNAATLDKMVKDFLDIVRSVEGAAALKMAQVSLAALVETVVPWTMVVTLSINSLRDNCFARAISESPFSSPTAGSSGVERTLYTSEGPSSDVSKKSVNVPPTSIPILYSISIIVLPVP